MFSIYVDDKLAYSDTYPDFGRKITSPQIKMEVDAAGSLDFVLHPENKCYNDIDIIRSKVVVKRFDKPIWIGRVIEESTDFDNNRNLHCEGAYAFLNDTCQPIREFKNKGLKEIVETVLNSHNERYTSDTDSHRRLYFGGQSVFKDETKIEYFATAYDYTIDVIKKLLDKYDCHCVVKVEKIPNKDEYVNKLYFFKEYYEHSKQTITFGKNLLDFTKKFNFSNVATRILPLAKTDRETSDEPIAVGTTLDLTTPLDYDAERGYGVLVPITNDYAVTINVNDERRKIEKNQCLNISGYDVDPVTKQASGPYNANIVIPYHHVGSGNTRKLLNIIKKTDQDSGNNNYEPFVFIKPDGSIPEYVRVYPSAGFAKVIPNQWNLHGDGTKDYVCTFRFWTKNVIYPHTLDDGSNRIDGIDDHPNDTYVNYPYACVDMPTDDTHTIDWAIPLKYSYVSAYKIDAYSSVRPTYDKDVHSIICKSLTEHTQGCIVPKKYVIPELSDPQMSVDPSMVSVFELDANKYKYFYLSASKTGYRTYVAGVGATGENYFPICAIFKCRKNASIWNTFKGFDDEDDINQSTYFSGNASVTHNIPKPDPALKGCEYWIFGDYSGDYTENDSKITIHGQDFPDRTRQWANYQVVARVAVGRRPPRTISECKEAFDANDGQKYRRGPFEWTNYYTKNNPEEGITKDGLYAWNGPLMEDDLSSQINTLDPNTYEFHKAINYIDICYEKKIDIGLSKEDLELYDRVLVVICSKTTPSINIVTEEEAAKIISIGADTNGIPTDKQVPERYKMDDGAWVVNRDRGDLTDDDCFDTSKGYGVMTPTDLGTISEKGFRLMNSSEVDNEKKENVKLNVTISGMINSSENPADQDPRSLIKRTRDDGMDNYEDYRVTVYILPASYEYIDSNGNTITEPNSVYLTTEMFGKSATYATFSTNIEPKDGNVWPNGKWGLDGHDRRLESIAYGKYINGLTKYNKKKITLPTAHPSAKGKKTYCILAVGSYNCSPSLYLHDEEQQTKTSYITIGTGDNYIDARSSNLFKTSYEYGDISTITGENIFIYTSDKMRTTDPIIINQNGFYSVSSESDKLHCVIYIYSYINGEKHLNRVVDIQDMTKASSIGYLYSGNEIRAVFTVTKENATDIELNDIDRVMLWTTTIIGNIDDVVNAIVKVDPVTGSITIDRSSADPGSEPSDIIDAFNYRSRTLVNNVAFDLREKPKYLRIETTLSDRMKNDTNNKYAVFYMIYFLEEYNDNGVVKKRLINNPPAWPAPTPDNIKAPDNAVECYIAMCVLNEQYDESDDQIISIYKTIDSRDITVNISTSSAERPKYEVPNGALDTYGIIEKRVEFDDVYTAEELKAAALDYLYAAQFEQMELSVSALDLDLLMPSTTLDEAMSLEVGDAIRVSSWPHGLNRNFAISTISVKLDDPTSMKFDLGFSNKDTLAKLFDKKRKD